MIERRQKNNLLPFLFLMIPNLKIEKELYNKGYQAICGMDEVGRGAWAGPLVIGAIILGKNQRKYGVRDSKELSFQKREELFSAILDFSIDYSFGEVSAKEIDILGLSKGIKLAAERCLSNLKIIPEIVLLDGKWNYLTSDIEVKTIVKGDSKSVSIASASIIAKVKRDRLLNILHKKHPSYNFENNKGYGTRQHQEAIKKHGLTDLHRKSYKI
ncbi:ribonuclease HII [bacterium CG_4_10_14_0_2_um_filter_33_32]|nr:MAG: ribonuclease HII [bacterium CG10_big_fil_rev_8_21_14_0_10_33_18]PIU76422.1 MAG: ribonuclease HII [bacterium CG06_land_8_20_14_3_00_33_50]PIW81069.1 MAG: ribonuclease HII [bacterium CG_4_8_14_3_um_filter_33_28]PIY85808.1 MAG: ribonuclease HII [bacterium CG_4_10_14_0_8_um_filter_33_57]PIZ85286.1 MAG: ribonuclease HII [bacterium CG_4_10_14_0_2_um_filter_33_32]PJA72524.1 MAG: ribonuclease HII [bacterium CG_4_9_14_3_um_filter_33_26]